MGSRLFKGGLNLSDEDVKRDDLPRSKHKFASSLEDKRLAAQVIIGSYLADNPAIAFSGGKDSTVLLHLVRDIEPNVPCIFLDHEAHWPETYRYVESIDNVHRFVYTEPWDPSQQGCCAYPKIELLKLAAKEYNTIFIGIRRDEHPARDVYPVEHYNNHTRVYPIIDWTEKDVWRYHLLHDIEVNPLYAQGYRSIGCINCTEKGDTERAGRGDKELIMHRLRELGYF